MSERYNGWANYETWRINMEMFDSFDPADLLSWYDLAEEKDKAVQEIAASLEHLADEIIATEIPKQSGFAYDLAQSFLHRVDFYEIAEHMVDDHIAASL